ncbi:hypothetical protein ABES02_08310 [Neobacillus pocheonensis]|uniref:hypothetical protein n=1 Tax=Neobacillus pocheonensis TaxID=363869 RepID=UPI003D2C823E
MFVAWVITISLFLICSYATIVIINGLKDKEQAELAELDVQLQKITLNNPELMKQVI